jgi:PTS system mannose-specific IIA component
VSDVIGLLLISHGQLGRVLLETAAEIVGPFERAEALSVSRRDRLSDVEARVEASIARLEGEDGVLVLADMFGGTAANVALRLVGRRRVEVVTGCNLPMLLKASTARPRSESLSALAQLIKFYGQRNVMLASEMLKEREQDG